MKMNPLSLKSAHARPRSLATAWHLRKLKRPLDGPDETLARTARARLGRLLHPPQGGDLLAPARPLAAHFHRASPAAASAKGTRDLCPFPSFAGITSESQDRCSALGMYGYMPDPPVSRPSDVLWMARCLANRAGGRLEQLAELLAEVERTTMSGWPQVLCMTYVGTAPGV